MKEEIKAWLKSANRGRDWLAEQTGVAKRTVDNWLSSPQEIPESTQRLIQKLMADDAALLREKDNAAISSPDNFPMTFGLTVTMAQFDKFNALAQEEGKLVREWAVEKLLEIAGIRSKDDEGIDGPIGDESPGIPYHEDCDIYAPPGHAASPHDTASPHAKEPGAMAG